MGVRRRGKSWYVDFRWKGKRYRERSPANTKGGAQEYELLLRSTLSRDGNLDALDPSALPPLSPRFSDFAERWMREYALRNAHSERQSKRSIMRCHLLPKLGSLRLTEIDAVVVDRLVKSLYDKGLKPKTINNVLSVLRRALRSARRWQLLEEVPHIPVEKAKRPPFRYLLETEAQSLVAAAPEGLWRTMVLTALHTGMRLNELLGLRWDAVDLSKDLIVIRAGMVLGRIKPTKTELWRTAPVGPTLRSALEALPRTSDLVFPMPSHLRAPQRHAWGRLRKISLAAGIKPSIGWHVLRHTWATLAVSSGVELDAVRAVLGHTDIRMTLVYAHFDTRRLARVAAAVEARLAGRGHTVVPSPAGDALEHQKTAQLSGS